MTHDSGSASVISASRFLLRHKSQFITKNVNCPTQRGWQLTFLLCVAISFSNVLHQFRTTDSRTTNRPRFQTLFLTSNPTLPKSSYQNSGEFSRLQVPYSSICRFNHKKIAKTKPHKLPHRSTVFQHLIKKKSIWASIFMKIFTIIFRKTFAESRFCFIFALAKQKEHSSIAQLVRAPDC